MSGQTWEQPPKFAKALQDELKPPYKVIDEDYRALLAIRIALGSCLVVGFVVGVLI
ncbi:MAG: hypothetical protein OER87_07565 [Gammaproteobacteria bacterium]|nr:hypothetical protein [Gammaproteobacteria bacterium]MDH3535586.1 hypothetical protein [Gammaproteobacteria bacterium]